MVFYYVTISGTYSIDN